MVSIGKALSALAVFVCTGVLANSAMSQDAVSKGEQADGDLRPLEAKDIAEDGFIYGLPLVMSYAIMHAYTMDRNSGSYTAPINQLYNGARVYTYKDKTIPLPNSDTPYSVLFMDLRAEPFVLSVPDMPEGRYYSIMLCDFNTYNYGYVGTRATGNDAGDYMVVGPDWKGETPTGIKKVFRASTQFSLAAYRTQLFSSEDMPNVEKVQAGYKAQPLSAYLKQPAPPAAAAIDFPNIGKELVKTNFFEYLDFILQFAPSSPEDAAVRAKLARIGVGPGKTFKFKDLWIAHKLEIGLGMKEGSEKVDKAADGLGTYVNNWKVGSIFGDNAFYRADWLKRAAAAKFGIFGNDAVEAMYPFVTKDAEGAALDGSTNKYTISFAANELPPVHAFWSITMYDPKTQHLIENPINRYLLNSEMLPSMSRNADGSLTLYIQKASPGKDKEANWLPSPDGPMYLLMRLYVPKITPPSILPAGEGTWKPPAVTKSL
jgi:hypothetical protein